MNEYPEVNAALSHAGERLRAAQPDEAAAQRALHGAHAKRSAASAQTERRRPWGIWGPVVGLSGATVAAAMFFLATAPDETLRQLPADTTSETSPLITAATSPPVPTTDSTSVSTVVVGDQTLDVTDLDDTRSQAPASSTIDSSPVVIFEFRSDECFRLTLATSAERLGSAEGCVAPDRLRSDERYLTEMNGEIFAINRLDDATPPTLSIDQVADWETTTCGIIDAFEQEPSADAVLELVACDDSVPATPTALAGWLPTGAAASPEYFAHGVNIAQDQLVPMSQPVSVDLLPGVDAFFGSPFDGFRCVAIVPQAVAGWAEQCWSIETGPLDAVIDLGGAVAQVDVANEAAPTGTVLDVRGLPSSGCSLDDISQLIVPRAPGTARPTLVGLICTDTNATADVSSTLLRNIGADGGFVEFARASRGETWDALGGGTAGEAVRALSIPPYPVWSSWPGQTAPWSANEFRRNGIDGVTFSNAVAARDALVDHLDQFSTEEFPLNPTVVFENDQLIVISTTVNDDDSIAGDTDYVHLVDVDGGVQVGAWFRSSSCRRGGPGPTEACV